MANIGSTGSASPPAGFFASSKDKALAAGHRLCVDGLVRVWKFNPSCDRDVIVAVYDPDYARDLGIEGARA